jgi:glucosamine-phosphate N-acetyltransferase
MDIRELNTSDDKNQYCLLLKQLTAINPEFISNESFIKRLQLIQTNPLHKIFIAEINGVIVGTITVLVEPKFIHDLLNVGHIEDVVVDREYNSKGIGRSLMEAAIKFCQKNDCYKIILDCTNDNIGFYQKFGFEIKENHMVRYL